MYEIFDPSKMSDQELDERRYKVTNMIMSYRRTGHIQLVESLEMTLAVMEEEWEYRMGRKAEEAEKERKRVLERSQSKHKKKNSTKKEPPKNPDIIIAGFIKGVDDV